MKRCIIIIVVFLMTIAACTVESVFIERAFGELTEEFAALRPVIAAHEDDTAVPECLQPAYEAERLWIRKKKLFSIILPHNALIELNMKITRLVSTLECDDFTMAQIELEDLLRTLPEYCERYAVTIQNIL